jgi:hypothetical protein
MAIDKKTLKEFILKNGKEAVEANKSRMKNLDEWNKRFEALRSTACLDKDVKSSPFYGASNVGIPVDATVVYTILARLVRATWGESPEIGVRPSDIKWAEHLQNYINWQLWNEMKMFIPLMMIYQGTLIDGDKIVKTVVEKDEIFFDDDTILFVDKKGNPYVSKETGAEVEAEDEDQPSIFDNDGGESVEYKPKLVKDFKRSRVVYYGPKAINCPTKHIIVPTDADTTDPSQIDWIIHEFWKPYWWVAQKAEQYPEIFSKEGVAALKKNKDKDRAMEQDPKLHILGVDQKTKTKRFKFWEWHGRYEDDKGDAHELIALSAPDEKEFMGFVPNRFFFKRGRRQFVHYTCFPQDGKFWGKGIPEWLRGIRSMLDAQINTGIDRDTLYDNMPIIFDVLNSGFNPTEHKLGVGKTWGLRKITTDAIRRLENSPSPQQSILREEMMQDIIQKLFGITDYSLGAQGRRGQAPGAKTASGMTRMIEEGNMRFDVIIRLIQQESNPELAYQVFSHFCMNRYSIMKEKSLRKPRSIFDPIMNMSQDELNADFEYEFKGNTQTVSPQIEQQMLENLYSLFTKTQNPFVMQDPDAVHDLTQAVINSCQVKAFKIKSVDEFRRMSATEQDKAKKIQREAKKQYQQGQEEQQPEPAMAGGESSNG